MDGTISPITLRDVRIFKGWFDASAQAALVEDLREVVRDAPFFDPITPGGRKMSVRMSAAGQFGWVSDRTGYRYDPRHPNGSHWPPIPEKLLKMWRVLVPKARPPECCLINYYGQAARMGLHQDRDEADFTQPVISVSLGDAGLFRIGNVERGGKTESIWLHSGDVVVMGGAARLIHHGIDRVRFGSSQLLRDGGRLNLTLRVVTSEKPCLSARLGP